MSSPSLCELGNKDVVSIIFFFILGISVGMFTGYLIRVFSFPIPYPVVVFFEGVLIAVAMKSTLPEIIDTVSESSIASDLVLYVFLPVLLFGEIMNLNWHHIKGGFNQSLLLAGPGALLAAALTAGIFQQTYGGWVPVWSYWVLGGILCATDPVSMVTLLKTTGASSKLTIVIVGESLMNDGSAMVLFFFFKGVVANGEMYNTPQVFLFIAEKLIASPALGIGIGLTSVYIMKRIYDDWNVTDMSIQIFITLLCAYSSFFMAEYGYGSATGSGVLAVCGAGAVFSWLCSPKVLKDPLMEEVWTYLEWISNTLIFLLGGILAGVSAYGAPVIWYGYLLALYVIVQAVRVGMVAALHPFVSRIGLKCSLKDSCFIAFCGVRGALAIALGLQFQSTLIAKSASGNEGEQFYFFISGVTAITLLINGSLGGWVLSLLQLVEDPNKPQSPEMKTVLRNVKRAIRRQVREEVESMDMELGQYNPEEVERLCKLMRSSFESANGDDYEPSKRLENSPIKPDLLAYVRNTFLEAVRAHYVESIHNGKIGTQASTAQLLLYSVDKAVDCINDEMDPERLGELGDLSCLERNLQPANWVERMAAGLDDLFARCGLHPGYIPYLESLNERRALFALTNFIDAHKAAQSKLHIFLGAPEKDVGTWLPEELNVMEASRKSIDRAKDLLKIIVKSKESKNITDFYNLRTARMVLIRQKDLISAMLTEGALSKKWAHAMLATIADDEVRNDKERASVSSFMVRDSIRLKTAEKKEMRLSLASNGSMIERDSVASGRASFRQSLKDGRPSLQQLDARGSLSFAGDFNDSFADGFQARPSYTQRPSYSISAAGAGGIGSDVAISVGGGGPAKMIAKEEPSPDTAATSSLNQL